MPMQQKGRFYEFHAERVISRPGQPIVTVGRNPDRPRKSRRRWPLQQLRSGRDIYTLNPRGCISYRSQPAPGRSGSG